jgi:hypothetical protein
MPSLTAGKVAAKDDGELGSVTVDYTPGQRPDIIAIDLENSKFKESTTPQPDVIRGDELVETWFDVITYNQLDNGALFLRREEFLVVSCECELREPSGDEGTGFLPTVWNGNDYTEGEWVSKTYGASASNQNSVYCDVCCRDHHDSAAYTLDEQKYDPSKDWTAPDADGDDHRHYDRSDADVLTEVTAAGQNYVEACRLLRKDGFMRVAQDFRQEGFLAFPAGYLDTGAGAEEYSHYVTDTVEDFYENSRSVLTAPDGTADPADPAAGFSYTFPASTSLTATTLPTELGLPSQQLRSRGIYIDHLGAEVATIIECLADGGTGDACGVPGVDNYLEVFPFFEVQTTWLSWWIENSGGNPVAVTNEGLETNNTHDRGLAARTGATAAEVIATTDMHRGNVGLAVIDPIDPLETSVAEATANYDLYIAVNGGGNPPPPTGDIWTGTFVSSVGGVNAADADLANGDNTICQRSASTIGCKTTFGSGGSLVISGYYKNAGTSLWICGSNLPDGMTIVNGDPSAAVKSATISWPAGTNATGIALTIRNRAC